MVKADFKVWQVISCFVRDKIFQFENFIFLTGTVSGCLMSPYQEVDNFVLTLVRKDGIQGRTCCCVAPFLIFTWITAY